jgi:hypothetical protein
MKKERGSYVYKYGENRALCFFVGHLACCGIVPYFASILATNLAW